MQTPERFTALDFRPHKYLTRLESHAHFRSGIRPSFASAYLLDCRYFRGSLRERNAPFA